MRRLFYRFGPYRLDARARVLYRGDVDANLPPKAAEILVALVQNAGQVVEKEELLARIWPDAVVGEGSLTRAVSVLRKALEVAPGSDGYVATVSKRGYRFVAPVTESREPNGNGWAQKLMLAVLPLANPQGDPEEEYFSDGLTEEMIIQLSRLNPERLGVIARTSAMRFKGSEKQIRDIGEALGVSLVLTGTVRRAGTKVRISAQLIQVEDQTNLWAGSYERTVEDIWKLQSEVARAIAGEVQVKLSPGQERRLDRIGEVAPEAYEAYLRGRHFFNCRTEHGMRRSVALYEEAVRRDPGFAMAHAAIADAYTMLACRGMTPARPILREARAAAERALHLDDELGDAHGSMAHLRLHSWDWDGLEEEFQRAIELSPSQAIYFYWYAEFLMSRGRGDDAVRLAEQARRTDPLSPVVNSALSMILYLARRYEQASAVLERALELNEQHFLLHLRLGLTRIQQRRHREGVRAMERAVELAGGSTETRAALALAHAAAGESASAERLTAELIHESSAHYILPYNLAKVFAAGGDTASALTWLDTAYEDANPDLIELNSEPIFDGLRGEPRFQELIRRVQAPR
jgi:TolB-like protein/tetratricopeptide (TPR) repeat protein